MYVLLGAIAALMNFTLDIPVEPHIKKFLTKELGQEPVMITRYDYLGVVVYDKVESLPLGVNPNCESNSKISIKLTYHQSQRLKSAYITPANINRINLYLKKLFKDKLFNYLNVKMELKVMRPVSIKAEILAFCGIYGIGESDYSLDALKKSYYRYRKPQTISNNSVQFKNRMAS